MFRVQVAGERTLINMARAVAEGPDHLRANLARGMRSAAQPTLRAAKRAAETTSVRGFPTARRSGRAYGGPSTRKGLRRRIAAAIDVDLDLGTLSPRAQFVVRTGQVGAGRVPEYIEKGDLWRHPIMGNRYAWAASQGEPYFEPSVTRHRPLFERRTGEALTRTARQIERSA